MNHTQTVEGAAATAAGDDRAKNPIVGSDRWRLWTTVTGKGQTKDTDRIYLFHPSYVP
jgi:hypothetical protein